MTDTQLLARFAIVCVLTIAALMVLDEILIRIADFELGNAANIATAIAPGIYVGQVYAQKTGEALAKGRMWRLAIIGTLINQALGILVMVTVLSWTEFSIADVLREFIAVLGLPLLAAIMAGALIIYALVTRYFIGLGQRQMLKAQENRT
jgi:hypothetical protein